MEVYNLIAPRKTDKSKQIIEIEKQFKKGTFIV